MNPATIWGWVKGRSVPEPASLLKLAKGLERRGGDLQTLAQELRQAAEELGGVGSWKCDRPPRSQPLCPRLGARGACVTRRGKNRWLLLGEYACKKCLRIELESYDERPDEVIIAGRRLSVRIKGSGR